MLKGLMFSCSRFQVYETFIVTCGADGAEPLANNGGLQQ